MRNFNKVKVYVLLLALVAIVLSACKKTNDPVIKKDPIITWANPVDITYGTLLSATQLNATADVTGTFVYKPASETELNVGVNQDLKVDFTPTDAASYNTASLTVKINVSAIVKKNPIITWANPADITLPTALSTSQLNATADVPGTFAYTPASGIVLSIGATQNLKSEFYTY